MKTFQLWATINTVHDGDTLYGIVDHGGGILSKGLSKNGMGLRLYGCNTIELEDPGGHETRDYLATLVPVGSEVEFVSRAWDKWNGRMDVSIFLPDIGDVSAHLIREGWAVPYFGKGPKLVPAWPRKV